MSKEAAAAILTSVYFQSSPVAASKVNAEVQQGGSKGSAPEMGGIAFVLQVYGKIFENMEKLSKQLETN